MYLRNSFIALGILVFVFVSNSLALSEIDCRSLIDESKEGSSNGLPLPEKTPSVIRDVPKEKYRKGYCYIKLEKYNEGLALLNGLEKELSPIPDYVFYYRAVAEKDLGNTIGAARDFYRILANYPESALRKRALLGLGNIYYDTGDYERAEKTFRIVYDEENQTEARALALYKIGGSLEGEKKYTEALSAYKELWQEFPESEFADAAIRKGFEISERESIPFEIKDPDYIKRADRLFKLSRWRSALENFDKVSERTDDIKLKIAISKYRLGLLDEASSILTKINSPESLYWMSKISIKFGRDDEAAETLSHIPLFYPQSQIAPRALYDAAKLYQANLNFDKSLALYDLLLRDYPKSEFAQDAAWNLGWIHYRNGMYTEASVTFSSINSAQAQYWKARTLEKEGKEQEALYIYQSLAHASPRSYYSYLAEKKAGSIQNPGASAEFSATKEGFIKENPVKDKAEFLIELGIFEDAILEIKEMEKRTKTQEDLLRVSELYSRANDFYSSIKIADKLDIPRATKLSYPMYIDGLVKEFSKKYGVDEFLVYSIIREESRFQKNVVSVSGAIGLMQLIPSTGKGTAERVGINGYRTDMLYIPNVNIQLGTAYFKEVLEEFDGNVAFALASYNGGPNNVARWIAKLGNLNSDEFVEEIPYGETRNYVKKVLRSYGAYKAIYNSHGH
jgi:peptidoglycan lytic transglycosylase